MDDLIFATTKHKRGNTTYLVVAFQSENATEKLDHKIKRLIEKDIIKNNLERNIS